MRLDDAGEGEMQQVEAIEVAAGESARPVRDEAEGVHVAGREEEGQGHVVGRAFGLELAQDGRLRLFALQSETEDLALLVDGRQRVVAILGPFLETMRGRAPLDAAAAPPEIALACEFRMPGPLEVGEAVERQPRRHDLLAGGGDQFGGVGDPVGLGGEPVGQWIVIDAGQGHFVHVGIIPYLPRHSGLFTSRDAGEVAL